MTRRRGVLLAGLVAALPRAHGREILVPPFSSPAWQHQPLPRVPRANAFAVLQEGGREVLHLRSQGAASSWLLRLRHPPGTQPVLQWRWKVTRALAGSDLRRKDGDDYAARVYVLFDLPLERLSLGDRLRLQAARALSGAELPAASLCYVWGTAQAAGASGWNAYTDRVRMVVVDSGDAHAGQWRGVTRELRGDWAAAFGGPMPPIAGLALSADTDNTGEAVEAWFTGLALREAP